MKNARPQNSRTSAKSKLDDMPTRLNGQAIQQPSDFALIDELPKGAWPRGLKPRQGKRTLFVLWPDGAGGSITVPATIARLGLPFILMAYDLSPLYNVARAMLEDEWKRGHVC